MTSRLSEAQTAVRPALKARMLLSGPYGAGKTRSALDIATVLAGEGSILGIDTEKESMLTYADDFAFWHLAWRPPFDVSEVAHTIAEAGGEFAVIILDSASHFWQKQGGILDVAGGKFTGWKEARPLQESFVEAILTTDAHVILCARSKVEYAQTEENGRHKVSRLGMAIVQDSELEYELNVVADFGMDHSATITKSRSTALPTQRVFRPGHIRDLAVTYAEWLAGGEPLLRKPEVDSLIEPLNGIADIEGRKVAKRRFVAAFGRPDHLRANRLDEATRWIVDYLAAAS